MATLVCHYILTNITDRMHRVLVGYVKKRQVEPVISRQKGDCSSHSVPCLSPLSTAKTYREIGSARRRNQAFCQFSGMVLSWLLRAG